MGFKGQSGMGENEQGEALKIEALRAAFDVGLEDVRQGRVVRLAAEEVAAYIADLGRTTDPET